MRSELFELISFRMAGLTLKWFIFLGRFWTDASAGVAKLPDSTSCIPKHSGGQEPPDGYHKMGTAAAPGDGTGWGGTTPRSLCHPFNMPRNWSCAKKCHLQLFLCAPDWSDVGCPHPAYTACAQAEITCCRRNPLQ